MSRTLLHDWVSSIEKNKNNTEELLKIAEDIYNTAYARGKASTERPQGRWIPVSERLPEFSGLYLISADDLVTVANFTGSYFMHRGGKVMVKVYAWQPLPKPYKKGDTE